MNAAYVTIALPLAGSVVLLLLGRKLGEPWAGWLATAMAAGSFVATVVAWAAMLGRSDAHRTVVLNIFGWVPVAGLHVNAALQLDPLSLTMGLFVTGVSSLIHLYSIGYMHGDEHFPRFFLLLNLFLFSMLTLVLADNFLFSFLGWEGVGFCSYQLVAFWFERETAAVAGKKAMVTNRVGDFGFLIAMFLVFNHFGSLNYTTVFSGLMGGAHGALATGTATGIALMFFLGAAGKSAQIPLYMWLPDAMEGPTPVSALIHAATMVTAGVYLMARIAPILHYSTSAQLVVASIGVATAFFAATIACAQSDIKRILAYSTLSQLGYMFMAIGSGGYSAGLFHMITHAFFKAVLFLAAGSVIHAMHEEQNVKKMGALARKLPITFVTFALGFLAISGFPGFSGFWSKDDTLYAAYHKNFAIFLVAAITAVLTAYYMSRGVALVFLGKARWHEARDHAGVGARSEAGAAITAGASAVTEEPVGADQHGGPAGQHAGGAGHGGHDTGDFEPHESPPVMTIPLILLGTLALIGGLINLPYGRWDWLTRWLSPVLPASIAPEVQIGTGTKVAISLLVAAACIVAIAAGLRLWTRKVDQPALEPEFLANGWYIDAELAAVVSGPVESGAEALTQDVDRGLIDGVVRGVAWVSTMSGQMLRKLQTGYVRNYALGLSAGAIAILFYLILRAGS